MILFDPSRNRIDSAPIKSVESGQNKRSHMSRWPKPEHSKKRVNAAGRVLIDPNATVVDRINALDIINNFRAIHGHPLNTFQTTLRIKGRRVDPDILVAQRIKRISSIYWKLSRFETMTLSQMQDIGGCRGVVADIKKVDDLVEAYLDSSLKHKLHTHDDYIRNPKPSGYRGIHLIYQYYSDRISFYNSLKIEMQLRSQAQHAWATAVEVVDTYTKQALKASQGEQGWLRFFALMGTAIAMMEGGPPAPDTPSSAPRLVAELQDIVQELDVLNRLRMYGEALNILDAEVTKDTHFFLLELDTLAMNLKIRGYNASEIEKAAEHYADAERRFEQQGAGDAVLVSVDALSSLRRAYPNYFLDTEYFLILTQSALDGDFDAI